MCELFPFVFPWSSLSPFFFSPFPLLSSKMPIFDIHFLAGWFLQVIRVMEVPVVKIREGEAGAEEKMMIKSIVHMVQYSV